MKQQADPQAVEAEEAVLGSLIIDPDTIPNVRAILEPADFYIAKNAVIYEAILGLYAEGAPVDLRTLAGRLNGDINDSYITGLITATPTCIHAEHYAGQVRKARVQRQLIAGGTELVKAAYNANGDLPEITGEARKAIAEAERLMLDTSTGLGLRASLDFYLNLIEKRDYDKDLPKLEFPWPTLAGLMPYLDAGTLVGILAESGVGKTAFMENCAEDWARLGWRVAFFHLELSDQMMLDRRMQRHSGVPIKRLQLGGQLDTGEYEKILTHSSKISLWPGDIHYIHCPGWSMPQIVATAQKLHDAQGLDVVIVDYLNKVRLVDRHGKGAAQLMADVIEDFKVALEVNSWVGLMAAQFDKQSKGLRRRDLGNALGTSALEHKANVGLVIDRPYKDDSQERVANTMIHVVKCNAGQQGTALLQYKGSELLFYATSFEKQPLDAA